MITNKTTHIHYTPRGTDYRILNHNLKIKQQDGTWGLGCSYIGKDQQVYVRPYSMFNETKFVFADSREHELAFENGETYLFSDMNKPFSVNSIMVVKDYLRSTIGDIQNLRSSR